MIALNFLCVPHRHVSQPACLQYAPAFHFDLHPGECKDDVISVCGCRIECNRAFDTAENSEINS